jgi:nucleoside-triphosphatase THEP1
MNLFQHRDHVGGFLCPDIEGVRHVFCLSNKQNVLLEAIHTEVEEVERVGRFAFRSLAMAICRNILLKGPERDDLVFVIDEVGKMELENRGLEPALSECFNKFNRQGPSCALIVVVRDTLLNEVREKYHLYDAVTCDITSLSELFSTP